VTLPFALALRNCSLLERITFEGMALPELDLSGSYTGEIDAEGIAVHGDLLMNNLHASGEARFPNSTIGGNLLARGSHFTHSKVEAEGLGFEGKIAFDAGSSQIRGVVEFCCGFEADGLVNLADSTIAGDLVFTGGTFNCPNNLAINANAASFDSVFLGTHPLMARYRGVHVNRLVQMHGLRASSLVVQTQRFRALQTRSTALSLGRVSPSLHPLGKRDAEKRRNGRLQGSLARYLSR
jgi:hypothetical protein